MRRWRRCLIGPLLMLATAEAPAPDAPPPEPSILAITINGIAEQDAAMILRRPDGIWATAAAIDHWRILRPKAAPITIDGEAFLPLTGVAGLKAEVDETSQTLKLTVPVELFVSQKLVGNALVVPKLTPAIPAAYLNYNIVAEGANDYSRVRGFFETGASNRLGVATASFTIGKLAFGSTVTRLDTYLIRDNPDSATRLTIGDAISASSAWSRPIRFGGVKFGTDFGLRPGFVTFPTADFSGRTTLPSNVEVFANGALRYRSDLDRGPFAINQAPLPVGAGQLTVVTRDILGVEQRTTTPYYISSNLLRAGLSRYSIEIGEERDEYALKSFDYRRPFVAAQWRGGVTDWLTVEYRGELGSLTRTIGGSVSSAAARIGEFGVTGAVSKGRGEDTGFLYGVYFSRVSPLWDVSITAQATTQAFTQLGVRQDIDKIRQQVQASAGVTMPHAGRFGVSLAVLEDGLHSKSRVASANYSVNAGRIGYLDAFALHASSNDSKDTFGIGIGLTIPLGSRKTSRSGVELQNGRPAVYTDYRVTPPTDRGWGYGGSVRVGAFDQQRADATWRTDFGEFRGDVARVAGDAGARLTAEGGLVLADGNVFATRRLDGSFGIIEAGGYPGVQVYQDNQPRTRTNSSGVAIIPALRPYEQNAIRLAPDDLPIGARLDADDVVVTPAYRSGVVARFSVRTGHPASVLLDLENGDPVPEGSTVVIDSGREQTFVGYGGEVFVSDLKRRMTVEVQLAEGKRCAVTVTSPEADAKADLPQIGPVVCRSVPAK